MALSQEKQTRRKSIGVLPIEKGEITPLSQKERIMKILKVTEEEAQEILDCDKEIDRGNRVYFDLDKETEKQAIKLANTDTHKSNGNRKVARKENQSKKTIMNDIIEALRHYDNFTIVNQERKATFTFGPDAFEVTLTQKRK